MFFSFNFPQVNYIAAFPLPPPIGVTWMSLGLTVDRRLRSRHFPSPLVNQQLFPPRAPLPLLLARSARSEAGQGGGEGGGGGRGGEQEGELVGGGGD